MCLIISLYEVLFKALLFGVCVHAFVRVFEHSHLNTVSWEMNVRSVESFLVSVCRLHSDFVNPETPLYFNSLSSVISTGKTALI